jgi:serine/threonine protein kinase
MLMFDPKKRLTAAEALAHPYFAEYGLSPHASSPSASSTRSSVRRSDISDSSMNLSHDTSDSSGNSSGIFDKST